MKGALELMASHHSLKAIAVSFCFYSLILNTGEKGSQKDMKLALSHAMEPKNNVAQICLTWTLKQKSQLCHNVGPVTVSNRSFEMKEDIGAGWIMGSRTTWSGLDVDWVPLRSLRVAICWSPQICKDLPKAHHSQHLLSDKAWLPMAQEIKWPQAGVVAQW